MGVMMVIIILWEQGKWIHSAYVSRSSERIGAAWKWATLVTLLVIAFVVFACWFTWEPYDGTALQEEARLKGFARRNLYYAATALLLLVAPMLQLYKVTRHGKNPKLTAKMWLLFVLEVLVLVAAFFIVYFTCPELLYGPYL